MTRSADRPAVRPADRKRNRENRRGREPRDLGESAFSPILAELVSRVAGARGAVLVDSEGETVDYAGRKPPFALRVVGAHWRIVLEHVRAQPSLSGVRMLAVRATRASYIVCSLPEGYALVLALARGSGATGHRRALAAMTSRIAEEAGWPKDANVTGRGRWYAVEAWTDRLGRPTALGPAARPRKLEILGSLVGAGLGRGETGWRVRVDTGLEINLVRERRGSRGFWYTDEPL